MYKNLYRIICIAIFFGGCNNIVFGEPNLETEESHLPSLYINKDRSNGINLIGKTRRQSIYIKDGKNMYGNAPKSIMNYVNKRATNQSPALSRQINAVNKKLTQNNSATKSAPVVVPQLKLNPITKNKETKSVSEALKLNDNEKIYICDKYRVFLNVVLSIVAYQLGEYVDADTTQKDKNSYEDVDYNKCNQILEMQINKFLNSLYEHTREGFTAPTQRGNNFNALFVNGATPVNHKDFGTFLYSIVARIVGLIEALNTYGIASFSSVKNVTNPHWEGNPTWKSDFNNFIEELQNVKAEFIWENNHTNIR